MDTKLILLVEDNADDELLLLRYLAKAGYDVQSQRVQTAADLKAALATRPWDIVISDYQMPNFTGLDALSILKESGRDIPFIIVSGIIGEEVAVEAMRLGVDDYLLKGNLARLAPAIEREMENAASRRARRQAEEDLRRSEASLTNAQRIAHIGNWDWDIQNNQIYWSREVYRILNLPKGSIENSPEFVYNYIHPDDIRQTQTVMNAVLSQAAPHNLEIRVIRSGGEERIVHIIGEATFDESGKPLRLTGTVQDITERKAAETEMRLMKRAFDSIVEGILISDTQKPDNPTIYTNAAFENLTGYTFEEIEGRNCRILRGAETNRRTVDEIREALERKETFHGEILNYHKNGTPFWNELSISPIFNESGSLTNFVGVQQDITNRKKAEEILRASEGYFRALIENISDIITILSVEGTILYESPSVEQLLGYHPEELSGKHAFDFVHPDDAEKVISYFQTAIENPATAVGVEYRFRHKTGSWLILESIGKLSDDPTRGSVVIVTSRDFTERRQAEKALRESENQLRTIFDNAAIGIALADLQNVPINTNPALRQMLGYTGEELQNTSFTELTHPDDVVKTAVFYQELFAGKRNYFQVEKRYIKKNGEAMWANLIISAISDVSGKPQFILGMIEDITKRKLAEQNIIFQAHLLDTVEQAIIATDLDRIVIYWNQFAEKLYGWTAAEAVGRNVRELTTPETGSEQVNQIAAQLNEGKSWTGEFMVRNKNGTAFPAHINNSPINDSKGKLIGIVGVSTDITERKRAEEALSRAEAKYRNLVESSLGIVYISEPYPPYSTVYVSPNIETYGYSVEEWYAKSDMWTCIVHTEDREHVLREFEYAAKHELETELEYRIVARDGTIHWWQDKGRFIADDEGNKIGWQGIILDITATKELEEQLRQAQKLESIGRLAGGIAHDFNNMLTAINGYSELTLRALAADNPLRRNIEEIKKAGTRSALLTHQLLAFSRRQVLQPVVLDLNAVITDTAKILERVIGEDVRLVIALKPKTGRVNVDPGQLSQIIMNLAVNARDAMPGGGTLTIETADVFLEPDEAKQKVGVVPGAYVQLIVCDTGDGMDENTREHIFEPFFTTKEVGRGTGLGLATVYGIVKQSGGNIEVDSQAGAGTVFRIYLPRVAEQSEAAKTTAALAASLTGTETILLVEDEELVRNLSREILESCGYTVIEAGDGIEALEVCASIDCRIDLLMTDVVMPRMGGRELAEKIKEQLPDLPILFTSGYTNHTDEAEGGALESGGNFIQKPFTFDALASKIRELLTAAES